MIFPVNDEQVINSKNTTLALYAHLEGYRKVAANLDAAGGFMPTQ